MEDLSNKNGIQVTVSDDRDVVTVVIFLKGKYESWVEFDLPQLDGLILEMEKARAILRDRAGQANT